MPMVKITFVDHEGGRQVVEAEPGVSLMLAAKEHGVDAISADCGGACACATCQVYVDEAWLAKTGEPSQDERAMLEFTNNLRANSRLSCQIMLTEALDGLIVETPAMQT